MLNFQIDEQNSLYYVHYSPTPLKDTTIVFLNPLTGDTQIWENMISPTIREQGYGTISFNYRGQTNSPFSPGLELDSTVIVNDTLNLLENIQSEKVILCGLSIGGLFAIEAFLTGNIKSRIAGLILINTLRKDSARLRWINDALVRCAEVGGLQLFRDLFVPLLFSEDWLLKNRSVFLTQEPYTPLATSEGHHNLLRNGCFSNWDQPYEKLELPVFVITGMQDRIFLDISDLNQLVERIPQCKHIMMRESGHLIPAEQPLQLTKYLLQFAEEVSS